MFNFSNTWTKKVMTEERVKDAFFYFWMMSRRLWQRKPSSSWLVRRRRSPSHRVGLCCPSQRFKNSLMHRWLREKAAAAMKHQQGGAFLKLSRYFMLKVIDSFHSVLLSAVNVTDRKVTIHILQRCRNMRQYFHFILSTTCCIKLNDSSSHNSLNPNWWENEHSNYQLIGTSYNDRNQRSLFVCSRLWPVRCRFWVEEIHHTCLQCCRKSFSSFTTCTGPTSFPPASLFEWSW